VIAQAQNKPLGTQEAIAGGISFPLFLIEMMTAIDLNAA
jgi:hypothetical protein